jgi:23S rRNA (adenine2503-C2)-methyltransferase
MENIFGYSLADCQALMQRLGEPKFRGGQLFQWLYEKGAPSFEACSNLPAKLRQKLAETAVIDHGEVVRHQRDPEDGTEKLLIRFQDGECIETVLMRYRYGLSLCVSSQVGCAMGCAFCASTKGGVIRNLKAGEIASQIYWAQALSGERVSRVVVMGIGEPLANGEELLKFIDLANHGYGIGQRRITVSTCGLVPQMKALAGRHLEINLAVSLHAPTQRVRETLMPVARRYSLPELLEACRYYFEETGRRITFEYALMAGVNDRPEDAETLIELFRHQNVHINLIRLNPISEGAFSGSEQVEAFADRLQKGGINCTIRRRMGKNIDAACGQLRHKTQQEKR